MDMVKGSLMMETVRLIRSNKHLNWDKHLTTEEMDLSKSKILPSNWYPLDAFQHMGYAIFMEVGRGDLKNAWQWGRFTMEELVGKSYKNLFQGLNTLAAFKKFVFFRKQFYKFRNPDFDLIQIESANESQAIISVILPFEKELLEPYGHQMAGSFERLVELSGGKNPKLEFVEKQWAGESQTKIKVTWE